MNKFPRLTDAEVRAVALQHGFKYKEQPDGTMDLNPYVYSFARELIETATALAAAPTPPAPEVEPVGEIVFNGASVNIGFYDAATPLTIKEGTELYTHPANDGLRKAAKKASVLLDYLEIEGVLKAKDELDTVRNLRAELDKGK